MRAHDKRMPDNERVMLLNQLLRDIDLGEDAYQRRLMAMREAAREPVARVASDPRFFACFV